MKIFWISTISGRFIGEAIQMVRSCGIDLDVMLVSPQDFAEERVTDKDIKKHLRWADAVLVDIRGGGRLDELLFEELQNDRANKTIIIFLGSPQLFSLGRLGSFDMSRFRKKDAVVKAGTSPHSIIKRIKMMQEVIEIIGKILPLGIFKDARNYVQIIKYWGFACPENCFNMFLLLSKYAGHKTPEIKPPIEALEYGIYHPVGGIYDNSEDYLKKFPLTTAKPTLGILFYGGAHFDQNKRIVEYFFKRLSKEFNVIPVFSDGINNIAAIKSFFFKEGRGIVDGILNFMWFRINGGPFGGDASLTKTVFKDLNVPVFSLSPMFLREIERWLESDVGLSQVEIITAVTWPELDGCIEPIPCCGLSASNPLGMAAFNELSVIEDRVERIIQRQKKWMFLKKTPNHKKRIALIVYGYPPGEANIAGAAYLDTFKSAYKLLEALIGEGYRVNLPDKPLSELFYECGIVNSGEWVDTILTQKNCPFLTKETYDEFFNALPERARNDVLESWGVSPGDVMTVEGNILIPGIECGNVFIGLQPARPPLNSEDVKKASHDKTKPPHHQYIGYYLWLEHIWKADAVIHLGTHGLAEFTKGKEVGMSSGCFPDILIGNLPNLYVYHVLNASEATIAKRRLYGTMISYNSPPYTTSDLYEDYAALEDYIQEYNEALINSPVRALMLKDTILETAKTLGIESEEPDVIHSELYRMRRTIIPKGLHTLGEVYRDDGIFEFMRLFLRYDHHPYRSIQRILSQETDSNYEDIIKEKDKHPKELERLDKISDELIQTYLNNGDISTVAKKYSLKKETQNELLRTLSYGDETAKKSIDNSKEIQTVIRGLSSEFIEAEVGGDVIRSPEVLPTGRNIVQFDPLKIPSETAVLRGAEIARNTLGVYYKKHKKYPESVGVILWGFETTQSQGETIGQIFYYIGVRLKKGYGFYKDIEVIPLEELKRPRIDCLINICGFFREMFPNLMDLLSKAFRVVGNLQEDINFNFIKKHSLDILDTQKDAPNAQFLRKAANCRIFGPPSSEYGTRLLPLVEDSVWEKEDDLTEVFISSMSHLHGENMHAVSAKDIYKSHLKNVSLVSQVRSSQDYDIVDLDHYYEFFGGLSRTVHSVRGEKPEMLISDTTKEAIETEDIGSVITAGARTRLLNPKWIDGMLSHGFHGVQKIADRVENILGLSATTGKVDERIWRDMAKRFVYDETMRKRLLNANKWAAQEIIKRLIEGGKRGYWSFNEEDQKKLFDALIDAEGRIEESVQC